MEEGWSREVMLIHIDANLYEREGKALTNFTRTLPAETSELAQELTKDPYSFEDATRHSYGSEQPVLSWESAKTRKANRLVVVMQLNNPPL